MPALSTPYRPAGIPGFTPTAKERVPYITRDALHSPERPVSKGGKQWGAELYGRDE